MWRLVLLILFSSFKFVFLEPVVENRKFQFSYDGYQLLKSDATKDFLEELETEYGIEVWRFRSSVDNTSDILISPNDIEKVKERITEQKASYRVVIPDLGQAIQDENPPVDEDDPPVRQSHPMDWDRYHQYDDIVAYMKFLAANRPDLCEVIQIGSSSEKRPLLVLKVSSKKGARTKPGIWVDGGIHAREWISPASVTYAIRELVESYEDNPELIEKTDWYFLPVVNPDGYQFTFTHNRLWRKTRSNTDNIRCKGVDANRNFGYQWGGEGTSNSPCSDIYRGSAPFSEPETKAMANFIEEKSASLKVYVTVHSYGQVILVPWGYKQKEYPRDFAEMKKLADIAARAIKDTTGTIFKTGQSADMLYPAAGGSDDWAKSEGISYSYTIELQDTGHHGFLLPASYIRTSGKELFAALKSMANHISP